MSRRSTRRRTGGSATPPSGTHSTTNPKLHAQARAALSAADADPLLDGLVGGYALEASHLLDAGPIGSIDLDQLVDMLAGEHAYEYAGHTAGVLERKSVDLLAAGYLVVRLREDDLAPLAIDNPQYKEFRVYSAAPQPRAVMGQIMQWVSAVSA